MEIQDSDHSIGREVVHQLCNQLLVLPGQVRIFLHVGLTRHETTVCCKYEAVLARSCMVMAIKSTRAITRYAMVSFSHAVCHGVIHANYLRAFGRNVEPV